VGLGYQDRLGLFAGPVDGDLMSVFHGFEQAFLMQVKQAASS
jgi:hypothetical protein